mgnify:CR=1 FL=1
MSLVNEGKRAAILGHELKLMGMRPGAADLLVVVEGRAHFLELKSADGVQSASQRDFQAACLLERIPYAICFDISSALKVQSEWKAIKPVRIAA